jgi:hypothetical protein
VGIKALFWALVLVAKTGASFDAAAERLVASGAAAADLRAPSAQVARIRAERTARARAEKKLEAALGKLGWKGSAEELQRLFAAAAGEPRYGSDGSVELTLSLSTHGLALSR